MEENTLNIHNIAKSMQLAEKELQKSNYIIAPSLYYEIKKLIDENQQYKQQIDDLVKWLEERINKLEKEKIDIKLSKGLDYSFALDDSISIYKQVLSKLKERNDE